MVAAIVSFTDQLRELGLRRGDWLAVFGDVQSTPAQIADDAALDGLIAQIVTAVGEEGHVLAPTFTHGDEFHPDRTPAATGRLAERFRRRPGVIRSRHATHSVAVLGPRARRIVTDHDLYLPFMPETPLGRLAAVGGKVLLFGCDQRHNALIHVARLSVERERPVIWLNVDHILEFGGRRKKRHVAVPCDRAYSALGPELEGCAIARRLETAWGPAVWMEARLLFERIAAIERDTPECLLCAMPTCRWCQEMRGLLCRGTSG